MTNGTGETRQLDVGYAQGYALHPWKLLFIGDSHTKPMGFDLGVIFCPSTAYWSGLWAWSSCPAWLKMWPLPPWEAPRHSMEGAVRTWRENPANSFSRRWTWSKLKPGWDLCKQPGEWGKWNPREGECLSQISTLAGCRESLTTCFSLETAYFLTQSHLASLAVDQAWANQRGRPVNESMQKSTDKGT